MAAGAGSSAGTSEWERNLNLVTQYKQRLASGEKLSPIDQYKYEQAQKRVETRAGTAETLHDLESRGYREQVRKVERTDALRTEFGKTNQHFNQMQNNIQASLAVLQDPSSSPGLQDKMLAKLMSQVEDTDVRAMQVISDMDVSYGNFVERTYRGISRYLSGSRSPAERAEIIDTLTRFEKNHIEPNTTKLISRYRELATKDKLDPLQVVPWRSVTDIKSAPPTVISRANKINAIKSFCTNNPNDPDCLKLQE